MRVWFFLFKYNFQKYLSLDLRLFLEMFVEQAAVSLQEGFSKHEAYLV
jgi:hypothetical protein